MRGPSSQAMTSSVLGHGDGECLADLVAAEGDLLSGDHDDAVFRGPALDLHRFLGRLRRRAGGTDTGQPGNVVRGQWVRAGPQQLPGVEVEETRRTRLDANADPTPAEDLRSQD
jgi:hypothetical protein